MTTPLHPRGSECDEGYGCECSYVGNIKEHIEFEYTYKLADFLEKPLSTRTAIILTIFEIVTLILIIFLNY